MSDDHSAGMALIAYVGATAGGAAGEVLADLDPNYQARPATAAYSVFVQLYFLFLHLVDRTEFSLGGDAARTGLQDAIGSLLVGNVDEFLIGRFGRTQARFEDDRELLEFFFGQLSDAGFAYARRATWPECLDELGAMTANALGATGNDIVRAQVTDATGIRGHACQDQHARGSGGVEPAARPLSGSRREPEAPPS
jgi:hypothetical protein